MRAEELFNAFDDLDADLLYDAHAKPQSRQYMIRRIAIAASFVLLIAASFLIYGLFAAPASYIRFDCRESVTVILNSRGNVLDVVSESGSFAKLNGDRLDVATAELISAMAENGSISRDENTLIIGTENLPQKDRDSLPGIAASILKQYDFDTAIITIACPKSDNSAAKSPAVSRMIDLLCESDSAFDRRSLSKLCTNDLALLWVDRGISDPSVTISGTPSDSGHIGFDAATSKALGMSSFDQAQIDDVRLSYNVYNGRLIYVVRLTSGDKSEAYFINAATGTTEQALKTPADKMQTAVEQEIKTSNEPTPSNTTQPPQAQQPTERHTAPTAPAPTVPAPASSPTEAESAAYGILSIGMKELSFVVQKVPDHAEPIPYQMLFEGQCFNIRNGEKQNTGSVAVITTWSAFQKYLTDHAYPYVDQNGNDPLYAVDEAYFRDHSMIAVSGVFSDASYYASLTDIRSTDTDVYLEASLSYGESQSGEYYCRALSLYGVDKSVINSNTNYIIY